MNTETALYAIACTLIIAMAGCANPRTADEVSVSYHHDPYQNLEVAHGSRWHRIEEGAFHLSSWAYLSGSRDGGDPRYVLWVVNSGLDWLFLDRAFERGGRPLPLRVDDREADGGSVIETLRVDLSPESLARFRREGLDARFIGDRGSIEFRIPAFYFDGVASKIERAFGLQPSEPRD